MREHQPAEEKEPVHGQPTVGAVAEVEEQDREREQATQGGEVGKLTSYLQGEEYQFQSRHSSTKAETKNNAIPKIAVPADNITASAEFINNDTAKATTPSIVIVNATL